MNIVFIVSVAVLLIGTWMFVRAIKGRLISNNPHCQGCKFDLVGLELNRDSICPECGKPIIPNTPTVQIGLRKRKPVLAALAIILILLGSVGVAWPKISQIPSIKNINWYAKSPEGLLLKLEAGGDKKALQTLHDQLIPGTLSDEGLQTLITRSLAMVDDESVEWDERWGDVLLYGFMYEKMSEKDMVAVIERSFQFEAFMLSEIGLATEEVAVRIKGVQVQRGHWSHQFKYQLARAMKPGETFPELDSPFQMYIEVVVPNSPGTNERGGGIGSSGRRYDPNEPGWWFPFEGYGGGIGSQMEVPTDLMEFDARFDTKVTVWKDDQVLHEWDEIIIKHSKRVAEPEYAKLLNRPEEIARIAKSLSMLSIQVPLNAQEAMAYDEISESSPSLTAIISSIEEDVGLVGTLWLDNGEDQIEFLRCSISKLANSHFMFGIPFMREGEPSWLTYFVEHEDFWKKARETGTVNIIYRPSSSTDKGSRHLDYIIKQPIIWANVPIIDIEPRQENIQQLDGTVVKRWRLSPVNAPVSGVSYTAKEYKARRQRFGTDCG